MTCVQNQGKQHMARSYKQGRMGIAKTPENIRGQATWWLCTFTSIYRFHPQCLLAQGSPIASLPNWLILPLWQRHQIVPLPLWALVCVREFPLLERHSKSVLCKGSLWFCREILLCNIGEYRHIASSYDQGQMDTLQTSQTRVWKHHECRGYSTQWTDTSPNASWFRKAVLTYFQIRLLIQLWEQCQCAASWTLRPGSWNGVAIPQKHGKRVLLFGDLWGGMRNPSFLYQGPAAHTLFVQSG